MEKSDHNYTINQIQQLLSITAVIQFNIDLTYKKLSHIGFESYQICFIEKIARHEVLEVPEAPKLSSQNLHV